MYVLDGCPGVGLGKLDSGRIFPMVLCEMPICVFFCCYFFLRGRVWLPERREEGALKVFLRFVTNSYFRSFSVFNYVYVLRPVQCSLGTPDVTMSPYH